MSSPEINKTPPTPNYLESQTLYEQPANLDEFLERYNGGATVETTANRIGHLVNSVVIGEEGGISAELAGHTLDEHHIRTLANFAIDIEDGLATHQEHKVVSESIPIIEAQLNQLKEDENLLVWLEGNHRVDGRRVQNTLEQWEALTPEQRRGEASLGEGEGGAPGKKVTYIDMRVDNAVEKKGPWGLGIRSGGRKILQKPGETKKRTLAGEMLASTTRSILPQADVTVQTTRAIVDRSTSAKRQAIRDGRRDAEQQRMDRIDDEAKRNVDKTKEYRRIVSERSRLLYELGLQKEASDLLDAVTWKQDLRQVQIERGKPFRLQELLISEAYKRWLIEQSNKT